MSDAIDDIKSDRAALIAELNAAGVTKWNGPGARVRFVATLTHRQAFTKMAASVSSAIVADSRATSSTCAPRSLAEPSGKS